MAGPEQSIDVGYIAELARLDIAPEALERLQQDMSRIVGYIAELSEVDVDGVEPTAHAVPLCNVVREDAVRPCFPRAVMLRNAPETVGNETIKVPSVLPGEGMS